MLRLILFAVMLVCFIGCTSVRQVAFEVLEPQEHLMHDTDMEGKHRFWYDGCRGRILESGDTLMIWWLNGAITDAPFSFKKGSSYTVKFKGDYGDELIEGSGKSLSLEQLVEVTEQ